MSISLAELRKAELSNLSSKLRTDENQIVTAIIKVEEPNYVPQDVKVRTRVDEQIFTAQFQAKILSELEKDQNVVSISLSKPLRMIK